MVNYYKTTTKYLGMLVILITVTQEITYLSVTLIFSHQ